VDDTSPASQKRYTALLRTLPPHQRLARALHLSNAVRTLALAGIKQLHPDASDEEMRVRLAVRLYGRDVAVRLFTTVPEDAR
jgi:hypothetical protein